ncbi:MAG: Ig-like domain-containing protein [Bacteroidaceae bacterium]|nr:Ig-like domain-containing protein [Bacteroidaceae bacterium]
MRLKNIILPLLAIPFLAAVLISCEDKGEPFSGMVPSVTIRQLNISAHSLTFSSESESSDLSVSSTNTSWEFTDIPSWITLSSLSGSNTAIIKVTVKENASTTSRVGIITLRSREDDWNYSTQLTVTQDRCSYSAVPQISSIVLDGAAGSKEVPVISNTDSWKVSVPSNASSWCSASKSADNVTVTVSANTTNVSRSVKIEVSTSESLEYITVTQRPANISSTTKNLTFPVGGGTESVSVQSDAGWTARTAYSWLEITPQTGPAGTVIVSVKALANNTTLDREGFVYLELSAQNRIEIPVRQEGIHLSVDRTELEFPVTSAKLQIQVTSNAPWKFCDGMPEWLTVTPSSGTGNASVTVEVKKNNNADSRQYRIYITPAAVDSPLEIDVFQAGHTLAADSTALHFSARAGQLTFQLESDADWVAGSDNGWISVSPTSGTGNETICVSATANESGTARTGIVSVEIEGRTIAIPVYQAGRYLTVSSKALDFTSKGGSTQVSLSSNVDWTIESGADWLSASLTGGSDDSSVTIKAKDNPSATPRSSYVTVKVQGLTPISIQATQAARYLRTSADTLTFFRRGGTSDAVLIETDGVCEITNTAAWITVNRLSATQFTVTAQDYTDGTEERQATLSLSLTDVVTGSVTKNVTVVQKDRVDMQYVDLGLSVKWATFNVGASSPEEYGDYFAWGETQPKSSYSWSTYKYCKGSDDSMTKYCNSSSYGYNGYTDNKTVLDPEDDAAHVNWGGDWRMPTTAEQDELCNTSNCTWTWTTLNGVNGYKVESKKSGYAGNYIFLPAAGYRSGTTLDIVGSYGYYWSSSLYARDPGYACGLDFDSGNVYWCSRSRNGGHSVRPVCPVPVTSISLNEQSVEIMEGGTETLTATVRYENGTTGNTATWTSSNTGVATVDQTGKVTAVSVGTCTISATSGSFTATCSVTVITTPTSSGSENGYEYVDLGLSVKWATCNVGATAPEGYGDYFAWGETSPKSDYRWSTYKYYNDSYDIMTKYCTNSSYGYTDNKTVLDMADDAAHVNWGGDWRMPTIAELDELRNTSNCTWTWTTMNGINGYKVVSKKSGFAGNYIFLPAAGYRSGTALGGVGSIGLYWSSSLYSSNPRSAYYLDFYSGNVDWDYNFRECGHSVRPVCPVPVTSISLNEQSVEIMEGGTETLTATVRYENGTTGNTATWTSSNTGVAAVDQTGKVAAVSVGTCTITATSGSCSATCSVIVKSSPYKYVDLGLSVKWATCNVGATKPEEYGDYFAWGETSPKSDYSWSTYKYCKGSSKKMTKYCSNGSYGYNGYTDNKTVLDLADDAAHVNWGGSWRLPTRAEQDELCNTSNCTWTRTTMNGVNGYKVVSKKSGYAGNWIFLPAAGYRYDTYLYNVGSDGYCWSSSLNTSTPGYACSLYFNSGSVGWYDDRSGGRSVRPICP